MQLIETVTVGSGGAASIEFTGIEQDATDLLVLFSGRGATSLSTLQLYYKINGDGGTNYSFRVLIGDGSGTQSGANALNRGYVGYVNDSGSTANTFNNASIYFPNYTSAVAKSISADDVTERNGTEARQTIMANSWSGTAAITSLLFYASSGNLLEHSTASLYKITKA